MKTQQELLKEISDFTRMIESDYPEVYQYLDENPITIPIENQPEVNTEDLENYLQSLHDILNKYKREEKL